jgi:hypothetical protein
MYKLEDASKYPDLTDYETPSVVSEVTSRYPSWYKQLTESGLYEAGQDTENTSYRVIDHGTLLSFRDSKMYSIDMRPGLLRGWGGRIRKLNAWHMYEINDENLMVIHNVTDERLEGCHNNDHIITIYSPTLDILHRFAFTGDYSVHKEGVVIRRPRFFGQPEHPEEEIIAFS